MRQRLIAVGVVVASACAALHYSTLEQQSVTVANSPYAFGGPGSQIFVVSPAGSAEHDALLAISPINCNSQWSVDTSLDTQQPVEGAHVCAGSSAITRPGGTTITCPRNYQFGVRYAGTLPGSSSCNVRIDTWQYGGMTYGGFTLALSGSGSAATGIAVSPTLVDFADVQILTQSSPAQVQVRNLGSAAVTVNGVLSGGPTFQVTPNSGSAFALGAGSSATFNVTCTPPAIGRRSGTLSFTTGASSGSASLGCNGIDSTVAVAPTQVDFGNTLVGRAPAKKTVMLSGNGSASIESVTLDAAAVAAGVTIDDNPAGQAVGSGQIVVLSYSAAAAHVAGPLGVLSVKLDVDASARSIGIRGQALLGGVGTNPAGIEFGAICVGSVVTRDVEVYASEAGDITLQGLTKPAAPFDAMAVEALPKLLAGNHAGPSLAVRTKLQPTEPGDLNGKLVLTSDVPMTDTTEIQLHGTAIADGVAATPDVVHFGTAAAGSTTSIREVQLTNCGTGDLELTRATLAGDGADEFILIGDNPPRTMKPTESEVFTLVMHPKRRGFKTASLVIQHSLGTTTALLDGTGEGGASGARETYYACSAGRGTAWWPVALVLLVLHRRRRSRR